jgi:hypothetical protein
LFLEGNLGLAGFLFSGIIWEKFRGVWRIENLCFYPTCALSVWFGKRERERKRRELRAESPKNLFRLGARNVGKGRKERRGKEGCPTSYALG